MGVCTRATLFYQVLFVTLPNVSPCFNGSMYSATSTVVMQRRIVTGQRSYLNLPMENFNHIPHFFLFFSIAVE